MSLSTITAVVMYLSLGFLAFLLCVSRPKNLSDLWRDVILLMAHGLPTVGLVLLWTPASVCYYKVLVILAVLVFVWRIAFDYWLWRRSKDTERVEDWLAAGYLVTLISFAVTYFW